jgi:hypothetical protein
MKKSFLGTCICIAGLLTIFYSTAFAQSFNTAIVYVRTGDSSPTGDPASISALTNMVAGLNSGATGTGYTYALVKVDTFTAAKDFNNNLPSNVQQVILVSHGVFSNRQYTGNLKDTNPETTPDTEVDPYFIRSYHCEADGLIDSDQVGAAIAAFHGHPYRSSTSTSNSSSGSTSTGGGGGTGGTTSGVWVQLSYNYEYSYYANGVFYIIAGTSTVWVYQESPWGGGEAAA